MVTQEIPKEVACRLNTPSTDWWDYSLASSASEYDEQSHDVCILFKHGCKISPETGLEVGTDVLLTFKTNVGNDLYMIVFLHDFWEVHRS